MDWILFKLYCGIIALLFVSVWFLCFVSSPDNNHVTFLELLSLIAPSTAHWPSEYSRLLVSNCSPAKLNVSCLLRHIITGRIEFRDPYIAIPCLLAGNLPSFALTLTVSWWFRVVKWLLIARFTQGDPISLRSLILSLYLSTPVPVYLSGTDHINLDTVPPRHIPKVLSSLDSFTNETLTIEFSCISPSIRFLSHQYILCSIPFLPQNQIPDFVRFTRTSTPLSITLQKTLATCFATSKTTPFYIKEILNLSIPYADALARLSNDLVNTPILRTAFMDKFGFEKWTNYRFMLVWEAALHRAGWLERWAIVYQKR